MSTHTRVWFSHFCVHVKRAKWQSNQARNSPCTLRLTCCCLLHVSFQRTSAPLIELSDLSGSLSLDLTGLEFQANLGQLLVPQSCVCVMLLWGLMSSEVGLTHWGQRVCVNHYPLFTEGQKIGSQLSLVSAATETFYLFSLVFVAALNYTLYKRKRKIVKLFTE